MDTLPGQKTKDERRDTTSVSLAINEYEVEVEDTDNLEDEEEDDIGECEFDMTSLKRYIVVLMNLFQFHNHSVVGAMLHNLYSSEGHQISQLSFLQETPTRDYQQ